MRQSCGHPLLPDVPNVEERERQDRAAERHQAEGEVDPIDLGHEACRKLGIENPRIAVTGLNPHAGEGGLFGDEETRLIEPAIRLAREGVPLNRQQAFLTDILAPVLTFESAGAAIYAPGGRALREGDRFVFAELADALELLGAEGAAPGPDAGEAPKGDGEIPKAKREIRKLKRKLRKSR